MGNRTWNRAALLGVGLILAGGAGWAAFLYRISQNSSVPQPAGEPRAATAIEVAGKVHDFGPVVQSQLQLEHVFPLVNRSQSPVEIRVQRVGCGCLEIECPPEVPAGGTARCVARLTLGGREGPLDVSAMCVTSEPGAPAFGLTLRCDIVPDVRMDPSRLEFHDVRMGEVLTAECRVITASPLGDSHETPGVKYELPVNGVTVEEIQTAQPEGLLNRLARTVHRFRMRIDTSRLPQQDGRALLVNAVVFRCAQGQQTAPRVLPVSVEFRHHNHLAGPRTITLRRSRAGEQTVSLKTFDNEPFAIESVHCSHAEVLAEHGRRAASVDQTVQVRCRATPKIEPQPPNVVSVGQSLIKCILSVRTDRWPDEPYEIEVLLVP